MITDFIDKNGLVKPRKAWSDSGNGLLYTVIYNVLTGSSINVLFLWRRDKGVLWRTPDNSFGQQSHDDYEALALELLKTNNSTIAKEILLSALKKFTFMQNSFNKGDLWKSFMLRFLQIWIVLTAAAFPNLIVKLICRLLLTAIVRLQTLNVKDASGTQLQWIQLYSLCLLGNQKPMINLLDKIHKQGTTLADIMRGYYDEGHPIVEGFRRF